jgi:hypothetical protein
MKNKKINTIFPLLTREGARGCAFLIIFITNINITLAEPKL